MERHRNVGQALENESKLDAYLNDFAERDATGYRAFVRDAEERGMPEREYVRHLSSASLPVTQRAARKIGKYANRFSQRFLDYPTEHPVNAAGTLAVPTITDAFLRGYFGFNSVALPQRPELSLSLDSLRNAANYPVDYVTAFGDAVHRGADGFYYGLQEGLCIGTALIAASLFSRLSAAAKTAKRNRAIDNRNNKRLGL